MTTSHHLPTDTLRTLLATAGTLLLFALAAPSSSAAGNPIVGAAGGCALQCIETALVTPTASSAQVRIVTAVRARIVVTARRLGPFGRIDGPAIKARGRFLKKSQTLALRGLEPERTYSISVAATDAAGHTASRAGRFQTRRVKTAGHSGADGLSAGLGCSAKCITKAVPVHVGPTAALFEVATSTPATITMVTSLAGTGSIVSIATSTPQTRSYQAVAAPLHPGTRYDLRIRATDAEGRTEHHHFSFRTVERKARVTFWKVQVISDGDKGVNRGELSFSYYLGAKLVQTDPFAKRSSGDTFDVRARGTSRPGLSGILEANGANPALDVRVLGEECDAVLMRNCVREVRDPLVPTGGSDHAFAGGPFNVDALLQPGALPGNYGTMMPGGHQAYLVFETTQHGVKFRVFASVDFFFDW